MNVGFTVKNTHQEPIDFVTTPKPYVGSYPLFTGNTHLKNWQEVITPKTIALLKSNGSWEGLYCTLSEIQNAVPAAGMAFQHIRQPKKVLSFHFALKQQQSTKSVKTQKTFFKAYWNEASGTVYHFNASTTYTLPQQNCLSHFVDFVERFVSILTSWRK